MGNRKPQGKKTPQEAKDYMNFVRKSNDSPEETISHSSEMLRGSNDSHCDDRIDKDIEVEKKPKKYVLWDFFRSNIALSIISAIIIGIGGYVINNHIAIKNIEYQVSQLEEEIDKLDENIVDKDTLSLQLSQIKLEISLQSYSDIKDIQSKLNEIENRVDEIEDN